MNSEPSIHGDEVPQESSPQSPPWLAWYRRYLYFALVLSAFGLLSQATVWGVGSFGGALLDVFVAGIVLRSLKRLHEKRTAMLHLAVNGATLLTALLFISGFISGTRVLDSLLMLLSVDFYALFGLFVIQYSWVEIVFLALSAYWLKNWYQFSLTIEDDQSSGEQEGQNNGDSDTASDSDS